MNDRETFYAAVIDELLPDTTASILVCGGATLDKQIFEGAGFTDVTISNLDERLHGDEYAPFKWQREDAESLSFADESFDYVTTHAAIHHAASPHRVVTEMYRVARRGVLAMEARDSLTMRLLTILGIVHTYEQAAVYFNDCKYGGVNNTSTPNYVYRWTEREIEKTIRSYAPHTQHRFTYRYGTALSSATQLERKASMKYLLLNGLRPLHWLLARLLPRQQNLFAFYIAKPALPDDLWPWLNWNNGSVTFNREWAKRKYHDPNPAITAHSTPLNGAPAPFLPRPQITRPGRTMLPGSTG